MPDSESAGVDDYLILDGIMIDLYRECALRHNALVDSVNEHNKEAASGGR